MKKIKVTIWNEGTHERRDEAVQKVYPDTIGGALKSFIETMESVIEVRHVSLYDEEQGFTQELLDDTDVLVYWAHVSHAEVKDEYVNRIYERVLNGMGIVLLHSAHASKIFNKLCGTHTSYLRWREAAEKERVWNINPTHPIAKGLPDQFLIPHTEMYGEHFNIPKPDDIIFISWYEGGNVFRSGITYTRGAGKIFYFSPGHETFPIYYQKEVQQVIKNGIEWVAPAFEETAMLKNGAPCDNVPLEEIKSVR